MSRLDLLPQEIAVELKKKKKKFIVKSIIKTVIFYLLGFGFLLLSEQKSESFDRYSEPYLFWFLCILVLVLPVFLFNIYILVTRRSFKGKVVGMKNQVRMDLSECGMFLRANAARIKYKDVCIVSFETEKGSNRRIVLENTEAVLIRDYCKIGDEVYYSEFSKIPLKYHGIYEKKFCVCCGNTQRGEDTCCAKCKVPFYDEKANRDEFDLWQEDFKI